MFQKIWFSILAYSLVNVSAFAGPLDGIRILIAENEIALLMLLESELGKLGAKIESVTNAHQALMKLFAEPDSFEVLITDLYMPQASPAQKEAYAQQDPRYPQHLPYLNGLELVRQMRKHGIRIPAILHSSGLTTERMNAMRGLTPSAALPKSASSSSRLLAHAIKKLLGDSASPSCATDPELTNIWPGQQAR